METVAMISRIFFGKAWAIIQAVCVLIVIVLAVGEGGSLFTILFDDLIGRSYSIEFTNFPCEIHYLYRSSWFGPTRKFLVTPEIMEDNEDKGEDSKTWVSKEVKGSKLGESDYFTDGFGATIVIVLRVAALMRMNENLRRAVHY